MLAQTGKAFDKDATDRAGPLRPLRIGQRCPACVLATATPPTRCWRRRSERRGSIAERRRWRPKRAVPPFCAGPFEPLVVHRRLSGRPGADYGGDRAKDFGQVKPVATCFLVAAIGLAPTLGQAQQHRGSADDQAACTPDVYRLCSQEIPDEDDIVACLDRKKAQLSPACKAVFSRPDPGKTPPDPSESDDN